MQHLLELRRRLMDLVAYYEGRILRLDIAIAEGSHADQWHRDRKNQQAPTRPKESYTRTEIGRAHV